MRVLDPNLFDAKAFAERLIQIRGDESRRSFAIRAGLADSSILKYERLEALPNVERFIAMAVVAGVDLRWLACGDDWERILAGATAIPSSGLSVQEAQEGAATHKIGSVDSTPCPLVGANDDFTFIDSYQVFASAGHGQYVNDEQKSDAMAFRTEWLRKEGLKPERLAVIRAKGDSMEPTISDNDIILLHLANGEAPRDGLHVIRMEGGLFVKRLQFSPLGDVKVVSDNANYQSWEFTKEQRADLHVVGRVVWAGKKF
ncbi:XRE family transcriptional regulator [Aeromonas salmonicida]|uniref:XRE family transcriptional regulator n=1 Tax=Aeromonas salmonicida TaxID=645 RepID=UPI002159FC4A|nr:LexA family transcriptional regulator [Aeromonas salmonicida]QYH27399.1 LexA family transcriptional regulator [Aeromonas salmonicida subsp. masoucida]QYH31688.1 LexA family transcriptional regulator [Aeromonas salmonicida subsp. masoucida]WGI38370.1 LexA family transcriptional regulator [Aeromonas salmonicida]